MTEQHFKDNNGSVEPTMIKDVIEMYDDSEWAIESASMFTNSQHLQFDGIHGGIQITHILSRAMEIVLSDIFQIPDNKFNEEKTFQCVAMTVLSGSLFIPILTHSLPNRQILFSPQTPTDPQLLPRRVLTWPKTPSKSNKSHLCQKLSTISLGEKIRNKPEELTKLECRVW